MKIINLYQFETTNTGDLNCSPCLYFDYDVEYHDICKARLVAPPVADAYIVGGGGAIRTPHHPLPGIKVAWGIGTRGEGEELLKDYTLVGTRDVGVRGTDWVPCPSCMSPLFDKRYKEEYNDVYYFNTIKEQPPHNGPVITNTRSFEEAIRFLGSASVVHTNSYHGAYWATLLGKAVVIVDPHNSKFFKYKHQPDGVRRYPDALPECREANVRFDGKVRDLLS